MGGGGGGTVSAKAVRGELETLTQFKDRVDGILKELDGSKASQSSVRSQEVNRASFGGEFAEAQDLYTEYNRVHAQLTKLSGVLGSQIEAMRIAVHAAEKDFRGVDEDVKRRFWQIQAQAQQFAQAQKSEDQKPAADDKQGVISPGEA